MEISNSLHKIDSIVLANYILKHYGPMSHLKLQKLLFYCDAYCLAYFGQELIEDKFETWVHGPVCRRVYDSLKDSAVLYDDLTYTDDGIDVDAEFKKPASVQQEYIITILNDLSQWTGMALERATHDETPWQEARRGLGESEKCDVLISKVTTRNFYSVNILPHTSKTVPGSEYVRLNRRLAEVIAMCKDDDEILPIGQSSVDNFRMIINTCQDNALVGWTLFPNNNGTLSMEYKSATVSAVLSIGYDMMSYSIEKENQLHIIGKEPFSAKYVEMLLQKIA